MRVHFLLFVALGVSSLNIARAAAVRPDKPNEAAFAAAEARFIRFVIHASVDGQPCIDELEVYGPEGKTNLALASAGAKATASSCLPGYAIHQIAHLNDGLYGNSHSWIAASTGEEWVQIELPRPAAVAKLVFSRDREGRFRDRVPTSAEVRLSMDGQTWRTVAEIDPRPVTTLVPPLPARSPLSEDELLPYAFSCEERTWHKAQATDSIERVLAQMQGILDRLEKKGLNVSGERTELARLRSREKSWRTSPTRDRSAEWDLFYAARLAKRRLFLRDPDLSAIGRILFVKRQPFVPSHNYSDILDATGEAGGGVFVLEVPRRDGSFDPSAAKLVRLFDAKNGIARDAVADFDGKRIHFAWQREKGQYFHLMSMAADGSDLRQLTDGPFHDFYPCPLPDGGLAFMSTRCKGRYLCWRPQAFVLFRMDAHGGNVRALSHANLSEWAPTVMRDGRILWTRSEYLDKGADFGHTLWAIRPDGSHPEMIFGNDTRYSYINAREVPGANELCVTLMSHGGDHNGPVALIEAAKGRFDPALVSNITPDSPPHFHMAWAQRECFRDPTPVARDFIIASHAPDDRFGLYVIDRWGNREVLYLDPAMGSMCPTPFAPVQRPPILSQLAAPEAEQKETGFFYIADVYRGLGRDVPRGAVKYIRVCQELRSELAALPGGGFQQDHEPFMDYYATPTHKVAGPYGWPTYVAKADLGTAPVETDGSANFQAPPGKVLYFQALDGEFNELQRMRSVVQLQPGERRGCIGCHEDRSSTPPSGRHPMAFRREASVLKPPPWGAGPFSYEKVVQPVWDARCVSCHDSRDRNINLAGSLDAEKVPASYRTLIEQGWVHYFDCQWGQEHNKAAPRTFGTLRSRLWTVLNAGHYDVVLTDEQKQRIKCWTDLNCPLWNDYTLRANRPGAIARSR